jgi:hypothetical protein
MNIGARVLVGALLALKLATAPAQPQSHGAAETSGWQAYTGAAMGFEARLPPGWRVRPASGSGPDTVSFDEVVQAPQAGMSVQFWVQRNANPTGLPIETWYANQVRALKSPPPVTTTALGGRTAVRREVARTGARHLSYYVALNATDVFQVTLQRPSAQQALDPASAAILSTVRFLQ